MRPTRSRWPARGLLAPGRRGFAHGQSASGTVIRRRVRIICLLLLLLLCFTGVVASVICAYLVADQTTNSLLCGPDSLVPGAGTPVGVVLGHTRCGNRSARDLRGSVRHVVLELSLVLLLFSLSLVFGSCNVSMAASWKYKIYGED